MGKRTDDRRYIIRGTMGHWDGPRVKFLNVSNSCWVADITQAQQFKFRQACMLVSDLAEEPADIFEKQAKFDMIEV